MIKKFAGFVVIAAMSVLLFFGAKQWIDNKNLRIEILEESYNRVEKERDDFKSELDKRQASETVSNDTVTKLEEVKATDTKKQTEAEKAVKEKVKQINDKYSKLPDTPNNRQLKEAEIVTERVRGLWKTYCITEPKATECVQ